MAYTIKKPSDISTKAPASLPTQTENTKNYGDFRDYIKSFDDYVKNQALKGVALAAESFGLPGSLLKSIGIDVLPTSEGIRKQLTEPYIAPNLPENYLQESQGYADIPAMTLGNIPLLLTLPGSFAGKLGLDVAGSLGMKTAEAAGGGPIAQLIGGLSGAAVGRKFFPKGSRVPNLQEIAKTAENKFYDYSKKIGEQIVADTPQFEKSLTKVNEQIAKSALDSTKRKALMETITQIAPINQKVRPNELLKHREELNNIVQQAKRGTIESRYLENILKSVRDAVDEVGKQFPLWGNITKQADAIHGARNYKFELSNLLENYPKLQKTVTNPIAQTVLAGGPGLFLGKGAAAALATGAGAAGLGYKKAQEAWGFLRDPKTQSLLFDAVANTISRNVPEAAKSYAKLNQEANKYEKQLKKQQSSTKNRGSYSLLRPTDQGNNLQQIRR